MLASLAVGIVSMRNTRYISETRMVFDESVQRQNRGEARLAIVEAQNERCQSDLQDVRQQLLSNNRVQSVLLDHTESLHTIQRTLRENFRSSDARTRSTDSRPSDQREVRP